MNNRKKLSKDSKWKDQEYRNLYANCYYHKRVSQKRKAMLEESKQIPLKNLKMAEYNKRKYRKSKLSDFDQVKEWLENLVGKDLERMARNRKYYENKKSRSV